MTELSIAAKAKIEEWVVSLKALPTVTETEQMVGEATEAQITEFCDSFGSASGQLAIFFQMMCSVAEKADAESTSDEPMKIVLSGQALERCQELSAMVLAHVDTSAAHVEMIDQGKLH
jgi:hypothetical protein